MPKNTYYDHSPRIFGKSGSEFIPEEHVVSSIANEIAPPLRRSVPQGVYADPNAPATTPDMSGIPTWMANAFMPVGTGSEVADTTPGENYLQDLKDAEAYQKSVIANKPPTRMPIQFTEQAPTLSQLPAVQSPDTGPLLNQLLRWYPIMSLLGGNRAANVILPAMAQGGQQYLEQDYQSQVAERALRQQMLDAAYAARFKEWEQRAENARYYNASIGQLGSTEQQRYATEVRGAGQGVSNARQVFTQGRRNLQQLIENKTHELTSGSLSQDTAFNVAKQIEQMERHLRDSYGGPEPGTALGSFDEFKQDYYNKMRALDQQTISAQEKSIRYATLQRELARYNMGGRMAMQTKLLDFEEWRTRQQIARQSADDAWHQYQIESSNWQTRMRLAGNYDMAAQRAEAETRKAGRGAIADRFHAAQARVNQLIQQKREADANIAKFEQVKANAGRRFEFSDPATWSVLGSTQFLEGFAEEFKKAQAELEQARDALNNPLPPASNIRNPYNPNEPPPVYRGPGYVPPKGKSDRGGRESSTSTQRRGPVGTHQMTDDERREKAIRDHQ